MKRLCCIPALAASLALLTVAAPAQAEIGLGQARGFVPREVVVKFEGERSARTVTLPRGSGVREATRALRRSAAVRVRGAPQLHHRHRLGFEAGPVLDPQRQRRDRRRQRRDAGEDDRAGAHRAGLERHVDDRARQAPAAEAAAAAWIASLSACADRRGGSPVAERGQLPSRGVEDQRADARHRGARRPRALQRPRHRRCMAFVCREQFVQSGTMTSSTTIACAGRVNGHGTARRRHDSPRRPTPQTR